MPWNIKYRSNSLSQSWRSMKRRVKGILPSIREIACGTENEANLRDTMYNSEYTRTSAIFQGSRILWRFRDVYSHPRESQREVNVVVAISMKASHPMRVYRTIIMLVKLLKYLFYCSSFMRHWSFSSTWKFVLVKKSKWKWRHDIFETGTNRLTATSDLPLWKCRNVILPMRIVSSRNEYESKSTGETSTCLCQSFFFSCTWEKLTHAFYFPFID